MHCFQRLSVHHVDDYNNSPVARDPALPNRFHAPNSSHDKSSSDLLCIPPPPLDQWWELHPSLPAPLDPDPAIRRLVTATWLSSVEVRRPLSRSSKMIISTYNVENGWICSSEIDSSKTSWSPCIRCTHNTQKHMHTIQTIRVKVQTYNMRYRIEFIQFLFEPVDVCITLLQTKREGFACEKGSSVKTHRFSNKHHALSPRRTPCSIPLLHKAPAAAALCSGTPPCTLSLCTRAQTLAPPQIHLLPILQIPPPPPQEMPPMTATLGLTSRTCVFARHHMDMVTLSVCMRAQGIRPRNYPCMCIRMHARRTHAHK